jgi:predicted ATPase/DNA-binding XRE family transcriptional regulator/Tfp pilus assembly protein PilF
MSIDKEPEDPSFGEWLRQRRRMLDLTQQALADQVGCTRITLRRIESGGRKPSKELALILLEKLGAPQVEREPWLRFARGLSGFPERSVDSFANKPRTNLPTSLTSFIGREKELDEITKLIAKNRLVTLTGVGGIGKTRLSIQVASGLFNERPNGTWLVELAPLSDPALVPHTITSTLGLIEQSGRSPLAILTDFLQSKHALLILDNCEHLIQACAELAETLLRACPDLHILATSREALGIAGETLYLVPALTTPDPVRVSLNILPDYEAVQLFVARAQSALAGFMLTPENAPTIAQVCHQLDGIPLALELAAARIKMMSVEQIASHLNDRFHLLTGGARTALPHHQTLRAMIDWSHDLLSEPERALLRRLSIFAGGWTLETAESVCSDEGIEKYEILDLLTQLLNKSLIVAEHKHGQGTRYQMLETICQYARGKLWAVREGEMMRQRHLAYFVDLAERAEPNLRSFDMVMWLDQLEAEHDNIRAVLARALESNVEAELRLASALLWFWQIRSHKNEGIDWLERGLSIEAAERGAEPLTPSRAMIRGKALNATGLLRDALFVGKAAEYFEESLNLFKELGPAGKPGLAYAFLGLAGWTGQTRGMTTEETTDLREHCLSLFRELGDKFGAAQCLLFIAGYARVKGDLERARAIEEEHLALRKEIGDKDGIAMAQAYLGLTVLRQGDAQQARELYEESLAGFREVGNIYFLGQALSWLSGIAQEQGNHEQAARLLQEGLTLAQNVGDVTMVANRFDDLGQLARTHGDYKLATKRFNEALIMSREAGYKFGISSALRGLGRVAQSQEDYIAARSFYSEAIVLSQEISNSLTVALNLAAFATLAAAQNKPELTVRLVGAAEAQIPSIRFEMFTKERAEYDQAVAAARAALGEETFIVAWEDGQKMTLDEAVSYALKED